MVLVFIFLAVLILILLLAFLIINSSLVINIKELFVSNIPEKQKAHYKIEISLKAFKYIKWIKISLTEEKVKKILEKPFVKIDFKKLEKDFKLEDIKVLKKLVPELAYLNLDANIGLENAITTSFTVALVASAISIILPNIIPKSEKLQNSSKKQDDTYTSKRKIKSLQKISKIQKNYKYQINPIFQNKNLYKINLNCIIQLKMVHIINVIYIFSKKGRSDKNERTTSNRKSYGYSYE